MKRRLKTWKVIDSLSEELREAIDESNIELIPGIAWELTFRAVLYALRKCEQRVRETWPQIRPRVPKLSPPLKMDYTTLLTALKDLDKSGRYSEDDWEVDEEELIELAENALEFVADVRAVAISKGDAS